MAGILATESLSSLGDSALLDLLRDLKTARSRIHSDELRVIAEIGTRGITDQRGVHVGTGALVREICNLNPGDVRKMVDQAEVLNGSVSPSGARIEPKLPVVAEALAEGVIAPEHVEVIRKAITKLPDNATVEDKVVA